MAITHHGRFGSGELASPQVRSITSIVAIIAAIASFYFSSRSSGLLALLLAFVAIGAGLIGGVRALSPRVSGGMLSILAVMLGAIAVIVALIALIV